MQKQSLISACLLLIIGLSLVCSTSAKSEGPSLLLTKARIHTLQSRITDGDHLLTTAYSQLLIEAQSYMNKDPQPIQGLLRVPRFYRDVDGHRAVARVIRAQSRSTHVLALAYALSGDTRYGIQAVNYLMSWVDNLSGPAHGGDIWDLLLLQYRADTPIVIYTAFPNFVYAFDLVRDLVTEEQQTAFANWLRLFVAYTIKEEFIKNNHHNWQSLFLLVSGHILTDKTLIQRAVRYYTNGLRVQIRSDGSLPLELRRKEKGSTYTLMALEAMVQFVAVAENLGISVADHKSIYHSTLKDAIDYLCRFLEEPTNWPNGPNWIYPDHAADWGYLFELPFRWWQDTQYLPYMQSRPYGHDNRAYTLLFATIYAEAIP